MGSEWQILTLVDTCFKIGSGATPRGGSKVYLNEGEISLIRSQNVYNAGFAREGLVYISPKHAEQLNNVEVTSNDILLNITGDSVARCYQVVDDVLPARVNQHVAIIRPDSEKLDPRFLRYYLVSPGMQRQMLSWAGSGGTRNALTKGMIESFKIPTPEDIKEQRAIAHILGSLDDKIELNRRMNETLEAMARAIFKSWFVDFLPVRAKMAAANKTPYVSTLPAAEKGKWFVYAIECYDGSIYIGQTEDLRQRWQQHFSGKGGRWTKGHPPVRVVHWELLPSQQEAIEREKWLKTGYGRKWLKQTIAAASARTQTGDPVRAKVEGRDPLSACGHAQAGGLPDEIYALFPDSFEDSDLGEIPKGWKSRSLYDSAKYVNGAAYRNFHFTDEEGALPVVKIAELKNGVTGQTKFTKTELDDKYRIGDGEILLSWSGNHDTSIDTFVWSGGAAWLNQHIFRVLPHQEIEKHFIFYLLKYLRPVFAEIARDKQTTGPGHFTAGDMKRLMVIHPPEELLAKFNNLEGQIFDRWYGNLFESNTLASLRDTLLPKLISGELRIPDAEKLVEGAV